MHWKGPFLAFLAWSKPSSLTIHFLGINDWFMRAQHFKSYKMDPLWINSESVNFLLYTYIRKYGVYTVIYGVYTVYGNPMFGSGQPYIYTVIFKVYTRLWPALHIHNLRNPRLSNTHIPNTHTCKMQTAYSTHTHTQTNTLAQLRTHTHNYARTHTHTHTHLLVLWLNCATLPKST